MARRNQRVELWQRDTHTISIACRVDGLPVPDIAHATLTYKLARNARSTGPDVFLTRVGGEPGMPINPDGVQVVLSTADTDRAPGIYYHELHIALSDGRQGLAMQGPFVVHARLP